MKKTRWIVAALAACAVALLAAGCKNSSDDPDEEPVPGLGYDADGWLIKDGAVRHYRGKAADVKIPEGVTKIGEHAFEGCVGVKSVVIPQGVTVIDDYAFYECESLASVAIPDSVTSIGNSAFYGCSSLASVTIPEGVTSIGGYAFYNCTSLTDVKIPEGVTSIGDYAFYGCTSLTDVKIPEGVTSIGNYAFSGCTSLASVTIPASVTSVGSSAFYNCNNLEKVTYNGTLAQWCGIDWEDYEANPLRNGNAVLYINGEELTVADNLAGVTKIKDYAFYNCKNLESVTIPEGVTSIGRSAFSGCSSLESVTIPASVKSVSSGGYSYSAFYNCNKLTDVYYAGTEEQWKKIKGIDDCGLSSWDMNVTIHGKDADGKDTTWDA